MTPLVLDPSAPHGRFDGRVLFGRSERPLFVPKGNDDFVREAIQLFVRSGVRRGLATLMLKIDHWLPQLRLLQTVKSMPLPLPEIYAELGISEERLALYYGSPGPLRKLTIYSSSTDRSVIKIALQPSADEMISNERKILALLAEHRIGVDFVPALLGHGQLSCGRRFVRTSVLPSGRRESRFGPMHRAFLVELYAHHTGASGWAQGRSYRSLQTQFAAIRNNLDDANRALLEAVVGDIAVLSGKEPVAQCIVHGDFAPWNIAVTNERLWVFDWENAVKHGNPLHDFLHFHLISEALLRRSQRSAVLKRLLADASRHLAFVAGEAPTPSLVAALTLHYLAEVVIFFCAADGTLRHSHPVIKSYLRLMQTRHSWLPGVSGNKEAAHER